MKRKIGLIVLAALILVAFCALPALAVPKNGKVPNGRAGKSPNGKLYLFEKDSVSWEIVNPGAWGKMTYKLWGDKFKFNFNGHGLEPGISYTLIYYPDGDDTAHWSAGAGLICLGSAIANDEGDVHIKDKLEDLCDLPADYDANYEYGAKIWLVLSDDIDESIDPLQMSGWNPGEYLFEYDLIRYDNPNCEYPEPVEVEPTTAQAE